MRRSLFWTFAGSFLLVLVTATLLQGLVIFAVVEPISSWWAGGRADDTARDAAGALAALDDPTEARIAEALRALPVVDRRVLVFRGKDGRIVSDRPLPPFSVDSFERLLAGEEIRLERPPRAGRGPAAGGPPGGGPPGGRRSGPPFGRPGDRPERDHTMRVLARHAVDSAAGLRGEVAVLGASPPFRLWPAHTPRPILLFLPIAIVLAAIGGLLLFRVLVRRLRAMETLAARVADGDLDVRVSEAGGDEIARLGGRLNRMTEGLAEARERIAAHEAQRRRLLADVSHELATPLTSIRGYAETLLDPNVPTSSDERTSYVENILDESGRMGWLIRDLFELTRLEADADRLETERLDWSDLCRRTLERFETRARERGIRLEWRGGDEPAVLDGDGRRLEQVLENLIVNALRYVPEGGTVEVAVRPAGAGYELLVSDDGPGIPESDLPHVFDRFYRADPARSVGGTGLGLAIVKQIVARHGGSVSASNREGGGVEFRIELP
jgi:signal transduction histidine kinase